jgi:hypothetical protein
MKRDQKHLILFVTVLFFITLFWMFWAAASAGIAKWAYYNRFPVDAGAWGDSFGAFNALFGAFGFAAVAMTLIVQQKAIRDQQVDQHIQRFEATFFELLKLMRELRGDLRFTKSLQRINAVQAKSNIRLRRNGADAITEAMSEMRYWLFINKQRNTNPNSAEISALYLKYVHSRFESKFSPYFRIIYTIFNSIRNDKFMDEAQKYYYGNIVRSQLSSHEISILAINSTTEISKDLSDIIIYFRLLKYIPENKTRNLLKIIFPEEAFLARD